MTLRQRTLLIVGVTLLCLLITLYLSLSTIWLDGFAKIELQQTHQNVERVTEAIANNLNELNSTAGDWATWDETYAFVKDGNERYIQENLADATLANLRLNVMLFANTAGRIIYSKSWDLEQKIAAPVCDRLKQYLATNPRLLQHEVAGSSHTGIVLLPEGSLLVASRPILKSNRTGSLRGSVILARFLDAAEVQRLSELTRLPLTVYPFQNGELPEDFQTVRRELGKEVSDSREKEKGKREKDDESPSPERSKFFQPREQQPIIVRPLSAERIAGYTLLRDIEGQPGLLLRVDTPRDIYQQGKQGLSYLLGALLAVGLAFGVVTLLLLEKSVLSPLADFSAAVRRIRAKGDLRERLSTNGKDELSRLGSAINELLATLQQSQLQLCQSEEKYRSVVDSVTEVIFQTDAAGMWKFLNPAWTEITGFSLEESLGKPCWTFIHPEDQAYHNQQFRQLIDGEMRDTRYEIRFRTRDGSDRTFEVHSRSTVICCSEIAGTAGTLNDITKRKRAEARERAKAEALEQTLLELTQTQAQLIQSEKMSSLGQLVAGVAHEINNPITFVSGNINHASEYIQNLLHLVYCYQQYYPNPPEVIKAEMEVTDFEFLVDDLPHVLGSMKVGTQRVCEIVRSLRNFSRLDESEIKSVDIHEGIESTLLMLRHQLKATGDYGKIELIKEYGNLPHVECYPGQLNQVLMNLLVNAIDALEEQRANKNRNASQASPLIRIGTEVKTRDAPLNGNSCAPSILIRIADNGTGMTEEVRLRLFDPFFTTKPTGKGTGLGLSISYQIIVEKHKGQLSVKSEPGHGTEFVIELPIRQSSH